LLGIETRRRGKDEKKRKHKATHSHEASGLYNGGIMTAEVMAVKLRHRESLGAAREKT